MLLMTYLQKYVFRVKEKTNVKVLSVITGINKAKTLIKDISCNCKCKFVSTTNNYVSVNCEWKKCYMCKKGYS